ncbi:hypothetical protein B5S28_g4349 [[Candida] boidinii]|nr:hypothetical protein B5S28_g4349 [[Candida] boidinii]OWB63857.1 hypothetical protein B5S29_g4870 [[Candida] boidinii]OWB71847.1 hypothetical protein B5S31_g1542 [[Candida] boidinii]OWB80700.1 hypothetical protein B5S32_g4995 [[Candida] boidinii]
MSWDDEDFDVPATSAKLADTWEEGVEDDEPVLDSWDIDSEEEREKEKEAKKKADEEKKIKNEILKAKKDALKNKKNGTDKKLLEIDTLDEDTRKKLLKEAELNSDLNNAADLFDGLGVADEHPRAKQTAALKLAASESSKAKFTKDTPLESHPLFQPTTKPEFEKLRKALSQAITPLYQESSLNYKSNLVIDLVRDVCEPLDSDNVRKVVSTLNAMITKKAKEERQLRLSKTGGTSTGGAGKKKIKGQVNVGASFKKDNIDDFIGGDDDFGDDDFM